MRIHAFSGRADSTSCPSGKFFYSCVGNGFRGCCSRDPCALSDCPDTMPSSNKDASETDSQGDAGRRDKNKSTATAEASEKPQATKSGKAEQASTKVMETTKVQRTTTMTDSGVTHTIPNDSVVTVTRHTLIITGRPTTTPTPTPTGSITGSSSINTVADGSGATSAPSPGQTDAASSGTNSGSSLSSGAIVGLGVGGAVVLAIMIVLLFAFKRRRKNKRDSRRASDSHHNAGREGLVEEKQFPQSMSAHTTGTQGSGDPFAPFGGRADQTGEAKSTSNGAFEMDATSSGPVELPAGSPVASSNYNKQAPIEAASSDNHRRLAPVKESTATDPRATLNSLGNDSGRPAYVNHWNQYKSLANG